MSKIMKMKAIHNGISVYKLVKKLSTMSKIMKMKAIHNIGLLRSVVLSTVYDVKDNENESNSQHLPIPLIFFSTVYDVKDNENESNSQPLVSMRGMVVNCLRCQR